MRCADNNARYLNLLATLLCLFDKYVCSYDNLAIITKKKKTLACPAFLFVLGKSPCIFVIVLLLLASMSLLLLDMLAIVFDII